MGHQLLKTNAIMKIFKSISILAMFAVAAFSVPAQSILTVRDTITDPHLVYPESFEADTHKMKQNWYMQNYLELDRNADTRADVPATDADYVERLKKMPTVIEMPFNSVVKSYIEMYVQRRRSLVERMLGMSIYYMPIFEQALENEGVPLELKYLPIIESALDPNAVSRAGATGLWQFMLTTARGLGLEINSLVDERRDPLRSSQMAAKYLRQLYDMYDDWSLAIAAYNCGPGNVNKAIRRAGDGKKDFWSIYPYLPAETRGYFPGFIAANYAMNYYDLHNISPVLAKHPIVTDTVNVTKRVHFQQIADVLDIPIEEIRILNPQYRYDVIPGDIKPYALVLPSHQILSYVVSEDSIVAHNAALYARRDVVEPSDGSTRISEDGNYIITEVVKYHKVRKGETFSSIARRYGVTVASIKRVNGIKTLRRGRTIKIVTTKRTPRPQEETPQEETPQEETAPVTENTDDEVVPAENISEDVDLTVDSPETSVSVDDSQAGGGNQAAETETDSDPGIEDQPAAPEAAPADSAAAQKVQNTFRREAQKESTEKPAVKSGKKDNTSKSKPVYHKVRKGENLSKIARRYGTTVAKIQSLNNISGSKIRAGQRIRVK